MHTYSKVRAPYYFEKCRYLGSMKLAMWLKIKEIEEEETMSRKKEGKRRPVWVRAKICVFLRMREWNFHFNYPIAHPSSQVDWGRKSEQVEGL